jgi:hypothetical protein
MPVPLVTSFERLARLLRGQALVRKIELACLEETAAEMARRGELKFDRGVGLSDKRWQLARTEELAELLAALAPHERAVRALDPQLALPDPTMWERELTPAQRDAALTSRKG